ncbi:Xaa-Pro aminopeptidase [Armatimonadetes bacterium GXS]|jgi:Xaa-Pro aminopeptidase|nr:Xaa-Pro aminopeptidase [Armatimonadetes bacterium GXS]
MAHELFRKRLAKVQEGMLAEGADAFLASTPVNMFYLSGFSEPPLERLMFLLVPREGDPVWFVPALSAESAEANPAGWAVRYVWHDSEGPANALQRLIQDYPQLETGVIAVDDEMPAMFLLILQEFLPAALFRRGGELMAHARAQKDATEIALMREAARLTDESLAAGLELCAEGYSEWSLALAIQRALYDAGSKLAFGIPIVASGENSSKPHYTTGHRLLQHGDVIVIDFGGVYEGYCNDITRVVSVGAAPEEAKKLYTIVYDAHMRAREAAKPGVPAQEVDRAARAVITEAGYGDYFVHRTGHGIGLSVHEPPYLVEGNTSPLEVGHCFTIEPGIYLPGRFGVRIENVYTLTEDGAVSLNAEPSTQIREIG